MKASRKALARIDARRMAGELEWAMEDPEYFSDWRNQIAYYRSMADKLPDQRRRIPIEGGHKAGPRAELEWQINDAEKAAESGDLGRYGLHIQAIVTTLHRLQLPAIEIALERKKQSQAGGNPRPKRRGTLRNVLDAMEYSSADDALAQWKAGATAGSYRLQFDPEAERPFQANGEAFTEKQVRQKVSAIKADSK